MNPEDVLAAVRHAFRREVWREIDQRAFICRLHRVTGSYRGRECDPGILPENRVPVPYFDVSYVRGAADRVAFRAYAVPGVAVGHTAGLARVDFG